MSQRMLEEMLEGITSICVWPLPNIYICIEPISGRCASSNYLHESVYKFKDLRDKLCKKKCVTGSKPKAFVSSS